MNKKRCNTLLPLVQLLPAVAAAAAVLFALPRTVPVLAAVGAALFLISDAVLLFVYFYVRPRKALRAVNLAAYYLGMLCLALSV